MENKEEIIDTIIISVVLIIVFSVHTFAYSNGLTNFFYERIRDLGIILLSSGFLVWGMILFKKTKNNVLLITSLLFVMILTLHLLRLFFGGIPC